MRERLREHIVKVQVERAKSSPNEGLIAYWEREMRAFEAGIARQKTTEENTMKAAKRKPVSAVSATAETLLRELREECETVVDLIRRLEAGPRSMRERDDLVGELSAAVLHLHTHTEGLDEFLCDGDSEQSRR